MRNSHIIALLIYVGIQIAVNNWYQNQKWFTHCYFIAHALVFVLLCFRFRYTHWMLVVGIVMGLGDIYREITDYTGIDPYNLVGRKFLPYITFCLGILLVIFLYGRTNNKKHL